MFTFPNTVEITLINLASQFFLNEVSEQDTQDRLEILKEQFGNGIYDRFKDIYYALIGTENCELKCTCGAKFTSVPNFHYDWCDLKRVTKPIIFDSKN